MSETKIGNWPAWRKARLALVILAGLGAIYHLLKTGEYQLFASFVLLLLVYVLWRWIKSSFAGSATPPRLVWTIVGLVALWTVLFLAVLPEVEESVAASAETVAKMEEQDRQAGWLDRTLAALEPVVALDSGQKTYAALAVSVPLLLFLFGAGPLSEHGSMCARPHGAAPGNGDVTQAAAVGGAAAGGTPARPDAAPVATGPTERPPDTGAGEAPTAGDATPDSPAEEDQ